MKTSILVYTFCLLFTGLILVSCASPQEKVEGAKVNLMEAQQKLSESRKYSIRKADWEEFKTASEKRIDANDQEIAELKTKRDEKGAFTYPAYDKQILALEERNMALQQRIDNYENYNSDWETFKREFNHDMDELGKTMKNISGNNSK